MLAFQAGDESAFERIVELYQNQVFSLLRRLLGSSASLEDLAQETFVRLFRSGERYQPQGRLMTYLYRITYNLALNHIRDEGRRPTSSSPRNAEGDWVEMENPESDITGSRADQHTWAQRIEVALAKLPENQRSALVLQHYDGLDLEEIGAVLGISAKAAKSLLHRARAGMRTLLEPYREAEQ